MKVSLYNVYNLNYRENRDIIELYWKEEEEWHEIIEDKFLEIKAWNKLIMYTNNFLKYHSISGQAPGWLKNLLLKRGTSFRKEEFK